MNTNAKKILLAGTAFLAVSFAGVGAAHAQVQDLNTAPVTVTAGHADGSNFSADIVADVAFNSANLTGPITNSTAGQGTLNFVGGTVNVVGTVGVGGTGGAINAITLGAGGSATTFGAAVNAGSVTFSGNGSATFSGATNISGAVGLGSGSLAIGGTNTVQVGSVTGTGTIMFNNGGTLTGSGAIAANSVVNTSGASTLNGAATIVAVNVNGGSLNITNAGSSISGLTQLGANTLSFGGSSIGAVTGVGGTLNLTTGTTAVGNVGSSGFNLGTVSIGTGAKTFGTDLYANTLSFTGAGTANLTATTTAGGQTINFAGQNGTVTYGAGVNYTGSATTTAPGTGHLAFGANATIGGGATIGGSPNTLNTVSFGGGVNTISAANIYATTVNMGVGTLNANGNINGALRFTDNGTVNLATGQNITGAITTASNGTGTLNLNGLAAGHTVAGAIGTSGDRLATVATENTTGTTTFTGGVNANTLTIASGGDVTVNGNSNITNAITLGSGLLTVGNAATFTAEGGIGTGGTNRVTLAGGNFATNAASNIATLNTTGTSEIGGTAGTAITTLNVNGGALTISNAASTVSGTTTLGANTLNFAGSSIGTVNGGVGTGTLNLTSGTTTVGTVGSSGNNLATVSVGTGVKTFGTDLYANTLSFTGAGEADLRNTTTANAQTISFGANNGTVRYGTGVTYSGTTTGTAGNLIFGDNATVGGSIGTAGNRLTSVSFGGGTNSFSTVLNAVTTNIGAGTTTGSANVNGNAHFTADGTLVMNDTQNITGTVTTAAPNTGTLTLAGGSMVSGAVGTGGAIKRININGTSPQEVIFSSTVNTKELAFAGDGRVIFNGNTSVTDNVAMGAATITVGPGATLTAEGGLTTSGSPVSGGVTLNGVGSNLTANAASSLRSVTKTGAGTSTVGGTGAVDIGSVSTNSGGTLAITNSGSRITGTAFVGAADTLDFSGSAIQDAVTGGGTLKLTSNATTLAAVGTSGQSLATVDVGAGAKTFGTDLYATNLIFSGTGTADLRNTTTANAQTINFHNNAGTVQYGTGVTYTGTASSTGGAAGTLLFGDNAVVNGTVGSGGNRIGGLTLSGGANTISQSIYATAINLGTGATAVGAGLTLDGNVSGAGAGQGTLNPAGLLNITGNLSQLAAMTLTNNVTVGGTAVAANLTDIGAHKLTVNGATFDTAGAATQLRFSVNSAMTSGQILATGSTLNILAGTRVNVSVDTAEYINQGQEYVLIDGSEAAASTIGLTTLTTTNTALLHFRQKLVATGPNDGTKNFVVYADRTQMNTAAKDPNNAAMGTMLDALGGAGDADITALQIRLANFATAAEVEAVLATLIPNVSGASTAATVNVAGTASTILSGRVNSLRTGDATYGTGTSSGNGFEDGHFWMQGFGAQADQDRRKNIAGYDSESYGTMVGVDAEVMDNLVAGVALAYANTDISGEDANRTGTDIDSYQVSLYADMDLENDYFVGGQVSYMYNDIETTRHNVGGLAGNTARADFHSNQYNVRGEAGRSFAVEQGISLTPSATVNYTYADVADYSEKGVGGLGLRNVKTDNLQVFELGVNLLAEMNLTDGHGGFVKPNLHTGYRYDLIGDDTSTVANLAGGGAAFRTEGVDPAQGTFNVGTGVRWSTASDLELSVNYDYESKTDYDAHSGYVRAGYKF